MSPEGRELAGMDVERMAAWAPNRAKDVCLASGYENRSIRVPQEQFMEKCLGIGKTARLETPTTKTNRITKE